jgi:hypothetical protein
LSPRSVRSRKRCPRGVDELEALAGLGFDAAIGAMVNWSRRWFKAAKRFAVDRGVEGVKADEQGGLVALAGQDAAEDSDKSRPAWLLGLLV